MRKKLLILYALLCLLPISAFSQTEFYYLPDAIDVSTLSNSSETKVVMHAGGSTVNKWIAANTVTGTDYYNDGFDAIDNTNANFIYTLVKDGSGNLSIRDSHGKYLPKWSGNNSGQFANNQTSANVYNFTLSGDASHKQDADGNAYTLTGSGTGGLPIVYLTDNSNHLGVNGNSDQTCESVTFQFFAVYDWEDLQTAITDAQTFYDGSFLNYTPSLKKLSQTIADVQTVYNNRSNLAKTDKEEAINKLHTAMNEAEAAIVTGRAHRQTFRFRNMGYATPLYMTVNNKDSNPNASNSSNCLLTQAWSETSAAKQTFTLVDGADGKFYIQWGDLRVTTDGSSRYNWNPSMTAEGFLFAFENRMLDDTNACYTMKSTRGWLGLNADASSGTDSPLYTNHDVLRANIHWFVEPLPLSAEQGKAALNDFIEEVNAWKTAYVDKLNNQATTSLQALATALTNAQTTYNNTESSLNDYKTAYNALYEAFSGARENYLAEAGSEQAFKLRSLAHGGNLYLYVKDNNLKGVVIKDNPAAPYLQDQMFKFVKGSADGQYKIQCVAGNGFMQNSEGDNYWDIQCADGEGSDYTVSYIGNNAYTISKSSENYFSPDNTLKEDGTYIVYSNWGTANAWVLEPVSTEEVEKGNNEYYKTLYELYQTYLPYKNLYVEAKAGLPGYPTSYTGAAPALFMDEQLTSAETLLNNPTSLQIHDVETCRNMFPHVRDNLLADLVNYPEDRYFSIKNTDNRGYLVYAADAPKGTETGSGEEWNYVWSTGKSYEVTSEAGTGGTQTSTVNITFDASNSAHLWCFLNHTKVDGTTEHYLYNVGFKKYARPTKVVGAYDYTWVLTDEPAPITLKIYDYRNRKMAITAKSAEVASDTEVYASVSNGFTGPVISYYTQNDGGVPFTFDWGTVEFAAADTTDVAALVRTPITLRPVAKATNPLITGLDDNQSICTYSSTKAFRVPAGVTAYYATRRDDNNIVRLKTVPDGIVPANEGVLLVGAVNKTEAMLDVDYRTEATADVNIFSNTASGPTPMGANCYVLARTDAEGIGFYHATQGTNLSQGKAYLDFSGSPVRAFTLSFGDDDVTTGISNIKADGNAENAPVYDLSGRRIAEPYGRGIYIKNGKKYFIK